jgi:hypothetical protein
MMPGQTHPDEEHVLELVNGPRAARPNESHSPSTVKGQTTMTRYAHDGVDTEMMKQIVDFLKGKLDGKDLADLLDMIGRAPAGNSTEASVAAMRALEEAQKDTSPVLGAGAMDSSINSAARLYRLALDKMGVQANGVMGLVPLKQIYQAHRQSRHATGRPLVAMDAAAEADFAKRWPHVARIGHA